MKGSLHFKSAATLSLEELADAFNAAFAGYFYPQQKTAASLRHHSEAAAPPLCATQTEQGEADKFFTLEG